MRNSLPSSVENSVKSQLRRGKIICSKIGTDGCAGHGAGGWGRSSAAWGNAGANPALYQEPYTLMNGLAA